MLPLLCGMSNIFFDFVLNSNTQLEECAGTTTSVIPCPQRLVTEESVGEMVKTMGTSNSLTKVTGFVQSIRDLEKACCPVTKLHNTLKIFKNNRCFFMSTPWWSKIRFPLYIFFDFIQSIKLIYW